MAEFGARLIPLGASCDGGRDMYYEGLLDWTGRSRANDPAAAPALLTRDRAAVVAPLGQPGRVGRLHGLPGQASRHARGAADRERAMAVDSSARRTRGMGQAGLPTSPHTRPPGVVTNVLLSSDPMQGGWAHIERGLRAYRANLEDSTRDTGASDARLRQLSRLNRIKHIRVIDGTAVGTLISVNDGVRRSFSALITVGDVFASLGELIGFVSDSTLFDTL